MEKIFVRVVSVLSIGLFFFPNVFNIIPMYYILFIVMFLFSIFNIKNRNFRDYFFLDTIKTILLFLVFINLFNNITRIADISDIQENYRYITGNSPSNLYFKVAFNGFISLLFFFSAYNFGRMLSYSTDFFLYYINIIIIICLVNGCANIIQWIITTVGIIGRYNFIPPLVPFYGVSISYSILGFLLVYSVGQYINWIRKVKLVLLLALLLSIVIIMTRQAQVNFVLILLVFTFLKKSNISVFLIFKSTLLIVLIGGFIFTLYNYLDLTELFVDSSSTESVDFLVRVDAFNEGIRIFRKNTLIGVGYGMFPLHTTSFFPIAGEFIVLMSPHNGLVAMLSEMGIIGMISSLILMGFSIAIFIKAKKKSLNNPLKFKFSSMILSITVISVISFFISNFYLLPPPSEYDYFANAFFMWSAIGFCSKNRIITNIH